jgi:ketosteroid isomerase-like protein
MTENEAAVRKAYQIAENKDVAGWVNCFTSDGTFTDQSIHVVDLKEAVEAAKGEVRILKMEGTSQPIADASTNFVAGK